MAPGIADKKNNALPLWGNEKTMNLNNLILTNILSSHYFKVNLYQLKTYHEVIDEIYYQVTHLEPWEKGSRKTSGQTGMCGGVRGVGAGGIVSTAFCILYKLFTLKLTRKQVVGLINHGDSPYIRALGFMYIRYTQPPVDLWDWYEPYLEDEEELDVKAGGGQIMSIGEMLRHFLSKLEWFSTLFPRIPVPIQKDLERKLSNWRATMKSKGLNHTHEQEWNDTAEQEVEVEWNEDSLYEMSVKHKSDLSEDIAREKDRQRKDKERHAGSSKRHHSSDRHRDYERHGSRGRSRSPLRSSEVKSHRDRETERHKDRHREKDRDGEKNRHKLHEHGKEKSSKRDVSDREKERWSSKDRLLNPHRRDVERKAGCSYEHVKRHEKHSSHTRDRHRY